MDKEKIKNLLPFLKQEKEKELDEEKQAPVNRNVTNPILQEQLLKNHTDEKKKFSVKDLLR